MTFHARNDCFDKSSVIYYYEQYRAQAKCLMKDENFDIEVLRCYYKHLVLSKIYRSIIIYKLPKEKANELYLLFLTKIKNFGD